jgi:6-phosphogluconate dehydrogenase
MNKTEFGIIGLGVMGKSLALNLAGKGIYISIFNRHVAGKEEGIAKAIIQEHPQLNMEGFDDLVEFVNSMERPRKIFMMIMAGAAVDAQIELFLPLLEPGDVIIDGGNSLYKDTGRRIEYLSKKDIYFLGVGVSGGEEGALKGPSIMPGGPKDGYAQVKKYFELIAAKDRHDKPCCSYIGEEGAGHFVKMVHNGIEYAEMQILAEVYYLFRYLLNLEPYIIANTLDEWQDQGAASYLLEITIDILRKNEGSDLLLDKILDQAEQKGTGGWSVNAALEHGVPFNVITDAVQARIISSYKSRRVEFAEKHKHSLGIFNGDQYVFINCLKNAYQSARIINHETGFALIRQVSEANNWHVNYSELARIWTNGCIIRSQLMEELEISLRKENSIFSYPPYIDKLRNWQKDLAKVVSTGLEAGFSLPVLSSALNYYLGSITANSPANLIQAQRDYFGAHTYRRVDMPPENYFHTNWKTE